MLPGGHQDQPALLFQYGSRCIVEALSSGGHRIDSVYICGGIAKSALFVQTLADVLGKSRLAGAVSRLGSAASGQGVFKSDMTWPSVTVITVDYVEFHRSDVIPVPLAC